MIGSYDDVDKVPFSTIPMIGLKNNVAENGTNCTIFRNFNKWFNHF